MKFSRRARWAVPAGALAAVGAVIAGARSRTPRPARPCRTRTPAQLLAAVAGRTGPLPAADRHRGRERVARHARPAGNGPAHLDHVAAHRLAHAPDLVRRRASLRLAVPGMMSESDLIGTAAPPGTGRATRTRSPASRCPPARTRPATGWRRPGHHPAAGRPAGPGRGRPQHAGHHAEQRHGGRRGGLPARARAQEQQARSSARCGSPSTRTHNVPLRVQVFARGARNPAFQVGYTSISFVRPAACELRLQPAAQRQGQDGHARRRTAGPAMLGPSRSRRPRPPLPGCWARTG